MAVPSLQLVKATEPASPETAKWDPELTKRVVGFLRPIAKRYFRSEIRDLGRIPAGGALLVSNHSGGPADAVAERDRLQRQDRICPRRH